MTRKSRTLCIDRQGKTWKRHRWSPIGCCDRCAVNRREWDATARRRWDGERLVGERGEIVELNGATVEREQGGGE